MKPSALASAIPLEAGTRGDLVLVFADKISRSWKQVIYFGKDRSHADADMESE